MKWFTSSTEAPAPAMPADHPPVPAGGAAKCPVDHAAMAAAPAPAAAADGAAKCPVDHASMAKPKAAPSDGAKCPIDHSGMPGAAAANVFGTAVGAPGSLNPLNSMPVGLSATQKAPGQKLDLPTEKTLSGIPRPPTEGESSSGSVWEYPSPQQFYNALVRKGWETPEESIEMVVDIHNWINEGAWDEVMKWEKRLPGGEDAQLARFQGRPGDLSPKARMHLFLGQLFPSKFNTDKPFDRHDWIVTRPILDAQGNKTKEEAAQRYVIDYYSAPNDEDGNPVFSLDVRPALDSFGAVSERIQVAVQEWMRGE